MAFNLRAKRKTTPLQMLRELSEDLAKVRPSDLDGMSEDEIKNIFLKIEKKASNTKIAVHGRGDNWIPVDSSNAYQANPLTTALPQFGGDDRAPKPYGRGTLGTGNYQINDEHGDPEKNTKGEASRGDFSSVLKRDEMSKAINSLIGDSFKLVYTFPHTIKATDIEARKIFGQEAKVEGNIAYVFVKGHNNAVQIQRKILDNLKLRVDIIVNHSK